MSVHQAIAAIARQPIWELDKEEAKALADGLYEVEKHYPILLMTPREQAWWNLGQIAAGVYGPRVALMVKAFFDPKAAPAPIAPRAAPPGPTVTPLRPAPAPTHADPFTSLHGGGPATGFTGATGANVGPNPPL